MRRHRKLIATIGATALIVGGAIDYHLTTSTTNPCVVGGVTYCAINPNVTQSTINKTICVTGWTATVRPSVSYTNSLKLKQMASEGLTGSPSDYEEDHRLPLELGGAPKDPYNLSPEVHPGSSVKDSAENFAKRQVCAGRDLRSIQQTFISNWLLPYPLYKH